MTDLEYRAVMELPRIGYSPKGWHRDRAYLLWRYLHTDPKWSLSDHERNDLWFLVWTYRRQVEDAALVLQANEHVNGVCYLAW